MGTVVAVTYGVIECVCVIFVRICIFVILDYLVISVQLLVNL